MTDKEREVRRLFSEVLYIMMKLDPTYGPRIREIIEDADTLLDFSDEAENLDKILVDLKKVLTKFKEIPGGKEILAEFREKIKAKEKKIKN